MKISRVAIALAVAGFISAAPVLAQQAPAPAPEQQREQVKDPAPISGELVALNVDTKTLAVKTDTGSEMKFTYTDETEILGADKGVSGLATMTGRTVTVTYKMHGTANTATKIEVRPAK